MCIRDRLGEIKAATVERRMPVEKQIWFSYRHLSIRVSSRWRLTGIEATSLYSIYSQFYIRNFSSLRILYCTLSGRCPRENFPILSPNSGSHPDLKLLDIYEPPSGNTCLESTIWKPENVLGNGQIGWPVPIRSQEEVPDSFFGMPTRDQQNEWHCSLSAHWMRLPILKLWNTTRVSSPRPLPGFAFMERCWVIAILFNEFYGNVAFQNRDLSCSSSSQMS